MSTDPYKEYLKQHSLDEILEKERQPQRVQAQPEISCSGNKRIYGVLFSDATSLLKYLNLDTGKILFILEPETPLNALLATDEEVYCGTASSSYPKGRVYSFLGKATYELDYPAYSLLKWKGRLVANHDYAIVDLSGKEPLSYSFPQIEAKKIMALSSLHVDAQDNLYALVLIPGFLRLANYHLREIKVVEKQLSLGETTLLETHPVNIYRGPKLILIPSGTTTGKNKENYDFSVLELDLYGKQQWLNQKPIVGVARCDEDKIHALRLSGYTDQSAEVVYSCGNQILQVELGLERKEVKERKVLADNLRHPAHIIEPVTALCLHHKLVGRGKEYG